jgi:tetratricopeptide (TPR) repeat protein
MLPLLVAALLALEPGVSTPLRPDGIGRQSIEELLERARRMQATAQQRLGGEIEAVLKEIESGPGPAELAQKVERLVALGEDATPLLVRHIDPGTSGTDKEKLVALQVAHALARMETAPVTDALIEVLRGGTPEGRRNSLRALANTREVARVRPEVENLFRSADATTKQLALKTLLGFGGPEVDVLLTTLLSSGDDAMIGIAIDGLAEQRATASVEPARKILLSPSSGPRHALALLRFFTAVKEVAQQADALAFVRIAQSSSLSLDQRATLIDGLPALAPTLNVELKKAMEPLVATNDRRLKEAALICLARLGDKPSLKAIVGDYDKRVKENDRWANAYVDRADLYARLGDDDEAIRDYRQAIVVGKDDPTLAMGKVSEKLARAYVRKGKLKDAAEVLNRAPIALKELQALADDPEFAPLRNSKYAKDAFGIK